MGSLPRATCHVCRASVAVRVSGKLREHRDHLHPMFGAPGRRADEVPLCEGSGQQAQELETPEAPRG